MMAIRYYTDRKRWLYYALPIICLFKIDTHFKTICMSALNDTQLRELAHKRVEFRTHLVVYIVINTSLWIIWYATGGNYPWPVWPLIGWGIGLFFHYVFDYRSSRIFSEQEEYERLKKQMEENKIS